MKNSILTAAALCAVLFSGSAIAGDFGGAYVGGDISFSKADFGASDDDGFAGGIFIGTGKQYGKWYVGGEIGAGLSSVDDNAAGIEQKNYYDATMRVGYVPNEKVMGYGLVGLQGGQFKTAAGTDSDYGFTFGAGVETFVKQNISLRTEIKYTDWQGENGLSNDSELKTTAKLAYRW